MSYGKKVMVFLPGGPLFSRKMAAMESRCIPAQKVPNKMDSKRTTPRHIIIKMPKVRDKERILNAAREKETITYKGVPIRLSADFSKEILQARRDWQEVFKVMKSKDLQPRLLYPAKLSFRMEGQIKCFPDKVNLKAVSYTHLTLPTIHVLCRSRWSPYH